MKKCTYILLLFLSFTCELFSQNTSPFDENNKPPGNSLFGGETKKNNQEVNSNNEDLPKQILKLVPSEFVRSELRLIYDYKLNKSLRATAGIGLPIGKDLINQQLNSCDIFKESSGVSFNCLWITDLYKVSKFNSGITMSGSVKYCPSNDTRRIDFFMELGYKFAHHNLEISKNLISHPIDDVKLSSNIHYFTMLYGNTWASGSGKPKWINEFSFGIGVKVESWDAIEMLQIDNYGDYSYHNSADRRSMAAPILVLRYCLGFGWD